ncbi:MAG: PadR family transcriptional regulator [Caldilineaceae bacterium]|nr:PadR family transcriptional regulator [Caldilineaceae bacterium]
MSQTTLGFATFPLEHLALGLLVEGPKHGYQLYQEYEELFRAIWKVGRSKFYAALASLHTAGYLDAVTEPQEDRPPRKIYQLTQSGHERFLKWLYQPVTPMRAIRVEFLAKLRFFTLLALPNPEQLIDAQIEVCQRTLAQWATASAADAHEDLFTELVHEFRQKQILWILDWLHNCRVRLLEIEN